MTALELRSSVKGLGLYSANSNYTNSIVIQAARFAIGTPHHTLSNNELNLLLKREVVVRTCEKGKAKPMSEHISSRRCRAHDKLSENIVCHLFELYLQLLTLLQINAFLASLPADNFLS